MNFPPVRSENISGYVINCKLSRLILIARKFIVIYHFKQQVRQISGGEGVQAETYTPLVSIIRDTRLNIKWPHFLRHPVHVIT